MGSNPWVGKSPKEKETAPHSSILAWKIPWTEESGRLLLLLPSSRTHFSHTLGSSSHFCSSAYNIPSLLLSPLVLSHCKLTHLLPFWLLFPWHYPTQIALVFVHFCFSTPSRRTASPILTLPFLLPTKVCLVKAMVFPVVRHGCESWTIEKAECQRMLKLLHNCTHLTR